jgi:DNA-binding response OmpR family regulator
LDAKFNPIICKKIESLSSRWIAMKILIVEDDEGTAAVLNQALTAQQYMVEMVTDGQLAWDLLEVFEYDLILLDVTLPKLDGISLCQRLREKGDCTPILLLTAQDSSTKKVAGLDAGADDYIVKPYNMDELSARIRALLRRSGLSLSPRLEWEALCLDPSNCEVTYNGQSLHITAREYKFLELFLRNTHRIFSQSALIDRLWSLEEYPTENTVRAHIKGLRQKLKKAGAAPDFIETVYGLGYRLKTQEPNLESAKEPEVQPTTNSTATVPTTIPSNLWAIWNRNKEKYSQRLRVVEQAIVDLQDNRLTPELLQAAQREAHTLKGSLGSFGLLEAVQLAREIEENLQIAKEAKVAPIINLSDVAEALRQELEKPIVGLSTSDTRPITIQPGTRLLIVDNDQELASALSLEAFAWGIQTEVTHTIAQARDAISHEPPDAILLDLGFSGATDSGLILLTELSATQSPIPVLVLTGAEQLGDRLVVARLGARVFLQKPLSAAQVMKEVSKVLAQSSPPDAKILVVDDDPQLLDFLRDFLEPWGFRLTLLDNPHQFWETLKQTNPDLLILDVEMPNFNGIELCQVVRNDPDWSDLPVLFLSIHTDADTIYQVFTAGADDFVNKPIVEPELVARILNRIDRTQMFRKLGQSDLKTNES